MKTAKRSSTARNPKAKTPAPERNKTGQAKESISEHSRAAKAVSRRLSIVGIGASAGGFEAFSQLLGHLPGDTGMAFVLVQHLDPTHESKLSELLSRTSPIPVHEIKHGVKVEPNHIYVIPQNVDLRLAGGHLRLTKRTGKAPHMPVDSFFRSLAEELKDLAIGVVLSGNGSDGTLGLQAIKGEGGITFAQNKESAKFFGMPGSAIASGCIDFTLSPEAIAKELARTANHPLLRTAGGDRGAWTELPDPEILFRDTDGEMGAVFGLLRSRAGVDFSWYKPTTIRRRILRRMVVHKIETLPAYLRMLQSNPAEVDALFNDILISVTGFFRDPRAYQALKRRVFPKLVKKRRPAEGALRVWVCGCSTGEEAYSLAIALLEFLEETKTHLQVQIFATDISDAALDKARAGVYPENIAGDLTPERLRRFFVKHNGDYRVNKSLRDICVFARQNVLADPPFSHLDLISCRNVLIYFGRDLQKRVLPTFNYALKPAGFLILGSSETVTASTDLFSLIDHRNKIYAKKNSHLGHGPLLVTRPVHDERPITQFAPSPGLGSEPKGSNLQDQVDRIVLARFSPAAVVIDRQMEVLQFRGRTSNYLEHSPGAASLNLMKLVRDSLMLDLRAAVAKVIRSGTAVKQNGLRLRHNGQTTEVSVEIVPFQVPPATEQFYLVLFEEAPARAAGRLLSERDRKAAAKNQKIAQRQEVLKLEEELGWTRESLQAIIEEQEATNEELKSANEEIQSSNEELQSTNEELETAKEELQSTNEELTTLNEELQNRNAELGQVNNDLTNLLSSVHMAIIMLGNDLTVRRFTPMAERVFNLIPTDVGRRLSDMNRSIVVPDLDLLLQQVIDSLTFVDREVQDGTGRWYSLRIRPYRTSDNKIDGAVLLLVDIDEHKRAIEEMMMMVKQPLIALQGDLRVKKANAKFYDTFGTAPEETENRYVYELGGGQWNIPQLRSLLEEVLPRNQRVNDYRVEAEFPGLGRRIMMLNARKFYEEGRGLPLILLLIDDVTDKA